ncbi:hypothetical protein [Brevundimonas sp.]|uniref:hypothetical protein n=1 Tax=Brevundimonas sp. TaxID=1871086 RepID=UPI00289E79DF|nr:hypothetical protein [Brevundimonas sp.]
MPEAHLNAINPADLPADDWIDYASFAAFMPGTNRRQVEDNAKAGRWIAGIRFSPRKAMHWRAGDVAKALNLSPTTVVEPGSIEFYERLKAAIRVANIALRTLSQGVSGLMEDMDDPAPYLCARDEARAQKGLESLVTQTGVIADMLRAREGQA